MANSVSVVFQSSAPMATARLTLRRELAEAVLLDEGAQRGDVRRELGAALGDDGVAQLAAAAEAVARVAGTLLDLCAS